MLTVLQFDMMFLHPILVSSLVLLIVSHLLIKWLVRSANKTKKMPPSPRKLPILGNMHQLSSLPHHNLHALATQHGPMMLLHFGSVPTLIVSSADAASHIMKTNDLIFSNRPESSVARRLLYDLKDVSMAPYGEYWRELKSICVLQLLSNKRVQSFHSIREEETALLVKKIEETCLSCSLPVDLSEMLTSLTNNVVCRAAFGKRYSEGESGKRFRKMLTEFLELLGTITIGEFIPCLSWINCLNGFDAKVDKIAKEVDEFLEGVIQERLEYGRETKEDDTVPGGNREDFVDILLKIYKDNTTGVPIDRDAIKALILDVFSAGTDTTSTVLEWAMTELLRHPMIMKKLQNEIRGVLGGKQDITDSDLGKMPYLKCVIKETLRLHPPIPLLVPRVASTDIELMGYDISAGTMVMINAWTIGRDPAYWDEPEKFKPERFLNSSIDFMGRDFHLIPFGAGRRICPGISFAIATNQLVLANLVHKFDWGLPNGSNGESLDVSERPGVAIRRRVPLLAVAEPRSF